MDTRREILQYLHYNPGSSRMEIAGGTDFSGSEATLKRLLAAMCESGDITTEGKARATRYSLSAKAHLLMPLSEQIPKVHLFTEGETNHLNALHSEFARNISEMSDLEYRKEMERLGIDLSWKSSQIEGNTYTLLETERLLRESKTADGKTKEEAIMLLNHKEALRFILDNPEYLQSLSVSHIDDIHSLLTKDLSIDSGLRHRHVGITGTNYHPLDNEFQIREAMHETCRLINSRECVFEKALLALHALPAMPY